MKCLRGRPIDRERRSAARPASSWPTYHYARTKREGARAFIAESPHRCVVSWSLRDDELLRERRAIAGARGKGGTGTHCGGAPTEAGVRCGGWRPERGCGSRPDPTQAEARPPRNVTTQPLN